MQVNNVNQQSKSIFMGYKRVKVVKNKIVPAQKGDMNTIKLFVAGGPEIDKKVIDANKKIVNESSTGKNDVSKIKLYFFSLLAVLGYKKPLKELLGLKNNQSL